MSIASEIDRLFAAFSRGCGDDRARAYSETLAQDVSEERLRLAVDYFRRAWDKETPPPLAKLRDYCLGRATEESDEQRDRRKAMRAHLESYSDADYWLFRDRYGVAPTRDLAAQLGVRIHADVTWRVPCRDEAAAERDVAWAEARAAVRRLYGRHGQEQEEIPF